MSSHSGPGGRASTTLTPWRPRLSPVTPFQPQPGWRTCTGPPRSAAPGTSPDQLTPVLPWVRLPPHTGEAPLAKLRRALSPTQPSPHTSPVSPGWAQLGRCQGAFPRRPQVPSLVEREAAHPGLRYAVRCGPAQTHLAPLWQVHTLTLPLVGQQPHPCTVTSGLALERPVAFLHSPPFLAPLPTPSSSLPSLWLLPWESLLNPGSGLLGKWHRTATQMPPGPAASHPWHHGPRCFVLCAKQCDGRMWLPVPVTRVPELGNWRLNPRVSPVCPVLCELFQPLSSHFGATQQQEHFELRVDTWR